MKLLSIAFAALVSACMSAGYQGSSSSGSYFTAADATYSAPQASATTATFINGYELTYDEKAQLEQLLGAVLPAGRYSIDAQYNFGREGEAPFANLAAYAQTSASDGAGARESSAGGRESSGQPFSMHSRDSAGQGSTLVSDGNGCMIMSTPSGSLSSGC